AVLDVLQQARAEIARTGAKGRAALELVMQLFSLDRSTAPVNAVLGWVGGWEKKAITKTGELGELLEYLDYFREADGSIPMPSREENAVRLITVHSVKGLEFKHVFILRATPPSFPASYKEALFGLPPASDLSSRLSATAVQNYEMCPLRFKLEREWGLPREVPAAMQYGAVMHRVLRAYYDSVRFERPYSDEALISLFRSDLADAGIQDRYQHELYEKQGIAQLLEFVAASRQVPFPNVAHTEEFFEVRFGKTAVVGRIDRIDRTGDGGVTIT